MELAKMMRRSSFADAHALIEAFKNASYLIKPLLLP
jgi:hypothetical protein